MIELSDSKGTRTMMLAAPTIDFESCVMRIRVFSQQLEVDGGVAQPIAEPVFQREILIDNTMTIDPETGALSPFQLEDAAPAFDYLMGIGIKEIGRYFETPLDAITVVVEQAIALTAEDDEE